MWFNRAALKAEARACMRFSKASPYVTALIYALISYVLSQLSLRLLFPSEYFYISVDYYRGVEVYVSPYLFERIFYEPFAYLINFLIDMASLMLSAGMVIFALNAAKRAGTSIGNLFDGFAQFLRIFLLSLIEGVFVFLWGLLFIIPGIVAAYRYRLAIYLLLDHPEMRVMDCIRESKRLMSGRKGELFVLDLSFFGWMLLSSIPYLGIAVSVYVTPYMEITRAGFYLAVTGADSRGDPGGRYGSEYGRTRSYEERYRRRGDDNDE